MVRSWPLLAAALGALTAGCEPISVPNVPCQEYAAPGITAVVFDGVTSIRLDGALVTAVDGAFLDSARVSALIPVVALAYERPGTYSVSAGKEGYETLVVQRTVTADRCHVVTVPLSFYLAPDGPP